MNDLDPIHVFTKRLKRINIGCKLVINYPFVYIIELNGEEVTEKFKSEYGFVLGYAPIRNNQVFKFSDISEIFKLIRKYSYRESE